MSNKGKYILMMLLNMFLFGNIVYAQKPCFTVSPNRGCAPLTVVVTECTNGGTDIRYEYGVKPVKYVSTTQHTYLALGTYTITQLIAQIASEPNSTTQTVEVLSSDDPLYKVEYCANFNVKLTITDTIYDSFVVKWGDSQIDTLYPKDTKIHVYASANPMIVSIKGQYNPSKCGKEITTTFSPIKDLVAPVIDSVSALITGGVLADVHSLSIGTYAFQQLKSDNLTLNAETDGISPVSKITWTAAATDQLYHYKLDYSSACADHYVSNEVAIPRLSIVATLQDLTVSWQNPVGIVGYSYELYRNGKSIYSGTNNSYIDKQVVCGLNYKYELKTTFPTGLTHSLPVSILFTSTNTPEAVDNLSASFSPSNQLIVSWDKSVSPVKGGYQVQVLQGNTVTKTVNTPTNSIVFNAGEVQQPSCFDVLFSDSCANISKISLPVCPIYLQGSELASQVSLLWSNYQANGSTNFEYIITLFDESGNVLLTKDVGNSLSSIFADIDTTIQIKRYRIKLKNQEIYSNTITIETLSTLFLPTGFSPNGDGVNDVFYAKGHYIKNFKMAVYSSAGQLIYVGDGMENGWDGNINGQPAPMGMYNYVVEASDQLGKAFNKKGAVTLIR